jgi:hypothetical protein
MTKGIASVFPLRQNPKPYPPFHHSRVFPYGQSNHVAVGHGSFSSKLEVASRVEPVPDAAEIALRDGALVGITRRATLLAAAERRRDAAVVRSRQVGVHNL